MVNNTSDDLWNIAILGKQVDEFMSSQIGKYMLSRADSEYMDGVERLKVCTADQLIETQSRVLRAQSIRQWLEEAVVSGLKALELIEEEEM